MQHIRQHETHNHRKRVKTVSVMVAEAEVRAHLDPLAP
jgi:hypothetical protein